MKSHSNYIKSFKTSAYKNDLGDNPTHKGNGEVENSAIELLV